MTIVGVVGDVKQGALDSRDRRRPTCRLIQRLRSPGNPIIGFFSEVNLIVRSDRPAAAIIGELSARDSAAGSRAAGFERAAGDRDRRRLGEAAALQHDGRGPSSPSSRCRSRRSGSTACWPTSSASRRTKIGVRMALGARASSVLWLVLRRALALMAIGVAIGLAGALGADARDGRPALRSPAARRDYVRRRVRRTGAAGAVGQPRPCVACDPRGPDRGAQD